MRAELVFLGTASTMPSKERSAPAVFFRFNEHRMLFDCGEGVQRQLAIAGISFMQVENVFVSHLHGDH
ncbi:MAG: MBL fold metallo-hydrolase, partial [Candidatus Diapherotrites archaeon]|nr:MBL fold metallo-hydrolase [Candidatus Diapherotrites archaeon]